MHPQSTTQRPRRLDLVGQQFSRLTVIAFATIDRFNAATWLCRCVCGGEKIVPTASLRNGGTKSCGCLSRENLHTQTWNQTHKGTNTKEYRSWCHMKARCLCPTNHAFSLYGGRGITICERWQNSFENFLADMGPAPTPRHSLDRIDVNGSYCPENVRWATDTEQSRNRRNNTVIEYDGVTLTLSAWAERMGMSTRMLWVRLTKSMWSVERALTEPIHLNKGPKRLPRP